MIRLEINAISKCAVLLFAGTYCGVVADSSECFGAPLFVIFLLFLLYGAVAIGGSVSFMSSA